MLRLQGLSRQEWKLDTTADYHRHVFRPSILLRIPYKRIKAFSLQKMLFDGSLYKNPLLSKNWNLKLFFEIPKFVYANLEETKTNLTHVTYLSQGKRCVSLENHIVFELNLFSFSLLNTSWALMDRMPSVSTSVMIDRGIVTPSLDRVLIHTKALSWSLARAQWK